MTRNLQLFCWYVLYCLYFNAQPAARGFLSLSSGLSVLGTLNSLSVDIMRYYPGGINESQNLKIRPEHPATYTSLVVVYAPLPIKASGAVHLIGRRPWNLQKSLHGHFYWTTVSIRINNVSVRGGKKIGKILCSWYKWTRLNVFLSLPCRSLQA